VSLARPHDVRRSSIRVALAATGVVAVVYLLVAGAVLAIVSGNLTAQVDGRLQQSLARIPDGPIPNDGHFEPDNDRPFGPALLVWTVKADGTVLTDASTPSLPECCLHVTGPITASISGTEFRIQGAPAGSDWVVAAQSLESVSQAEGTLILAELIIGPALLVLVFLGALTIGRRVAAPIEAARQRQLEFTADASHELRTPLAVIEAHASLALAQERQATWYRSAFERVDHEAKRMHRLVDDLLWLARFDASRRTPASEPVDLGTLAVQAANRFDVVAEARGLRLAVTAPPSGAVVAAPAEWLDRLLGVLLDNACKYSPEGGAVTVAVAHEGGRVRLTVDDAGSGIPEDQRAKIFDRFHRATESVNGAGLGLAIGDAVVRATGGRWQVGVSPAGGARLSVSWPAAA
jgi:two-component system sensor histidine kinase CiaH